jgi:hypothetical protein
MNHTDNINVISNIENYWCDRMSYLVDENRIADADSLFAEFSIDGQDPTEWFYLEYLNNQ